jgi:hypothetical protein
MTSHDSSEDSDLNEHMEEPPYPNNLFMKYGGFERVRKIAAKLQTKISSNELLAPFFENVDTRSHIKNQEQYLKVRNLKLCLILLDALWRGK